MWYFAAIQYLHAIAFHTHTGMSVQWFNGSCSTTGIHSYSKSMQLKNKNKKKKNHTELVYSQIFNMLSNDFSGLLVN